MCDPLKWTVVVKDLTPGFHVHIRQQSIFHKTFKQQLNPDRKLMETEQALPHLIGQKKMDRISVQDGHLMNWQKQNH